MADLRLPKTYRIVRNRNGRYAIESSFSIHGVDFNLWSNEWFSTAGSAIRKFEEDVKVKRQLHNETVYEPVDDKIIEVEEV